MKTKELVASAQIESLELKYRELERRCLQRLKPSLMMVKRFAYPAKMPIAFSLEIRALITHLVRARKIFDLPISQIDRECFDAAKENIDKANGHYERCMLDCSKWMCIQLDDLTRNSLAELTAKVPLVRVANGDYLEALHAKERRARELHLEAKQLDAKGSETVNDKYEDAVEAYNDLYILLENPDEEKREQIKSLRQQELVSKFHIYVKALLGIIIAIFWFVINFL